MQTKHKVLDVTKYSASAFTITMERNKLQFEPGACVAIKGKPYSIASSPNDAYIKLFIRKIDGGQVSTYLSNQTYGDIVEITDTFNYFYPGRDCDDGRYVFVATGVGISPFLSALNFYTHKPCVLCYGVRTYEEIIDPNVFKHIHKTHITISRDPNISPKIPKRITDLRILKYIPISKRHKYFLCGVSEMIDDVSNYLTNKGVNTSQIISELFFV